MKQFMDENFLLETATAQNLYHNHAAKIPAVSICYNNFSHITA